MIKVFDNGKNAKLKELILSAPGANYKLVATYLGSNKAWAAGLYKALKASGEGFIPKNKLIWELINQAEGTDGGDGDSFE